IDLGSKEQPRWLNTRLYLLALLLTRIGRIKCFVFVEARDGVRKRFVGATSPDTLRWSLARRYPVLEYSYAAAYHMVQQNQAFGTLSDFQADELTRQFVLILQDRSEIKIPSPQAQGDRIPVRGGAELAEWMDGALIERILGGELDVETVTLSAGQGL